MSVQEKIKYLEFIQDIIKRQASNSFLIKGFNATFLILFLFAKVKYDLDLSFLYIYLVVVLSFALFDYYFLSNERKYRELYNDVRLDKVENFDLDVSKYKIQFSNILFSFNTCWYIFYVVLGLMIFTV